MYMLKDSKCIICIGKSGVPSITRYCKTKDHGNKNRVVREREVDRCAISQREGAKPSLSYIGR